MRLEYGEQRNKPMGGGEGVPDVSGGQSTVTWLEEKAKVKQTRKTDADGLSCVTETPSW